MATDDSDFRIRPGRSRSRGTRVNPRTQSFLTQVKVAVRKAGGNPNWISRSAGGREGKSSGRFNARGRGVATALTLRDRSAWSRDGSGVRTRARRVAVKARVCDGSRGPHYHNVASRVTPSDKKTGLRPTSRMHQSANTDAPT